MDEEWENSACSMWASAGGQSWGREEESLLAGSLWIAQG